MDNFEYLSTQQIVDCGSYPLTKAQLRHLLLFRHRNGLGKAVRRIGKRLYFRRDLLNDWFESHQEAQS